MLANNVANAGTSGFKADREFNRLWESELPYIEKNWVDFSQGTLVETSNPLNVALSGKGFFAVTAPDGSVLYTRNGELRVSKSGELETADGNKLRNTMDQGRPIRVDASAPIEIDKDGVVRQHWQEAGKIEIADIEKAAAAKRGNTYFQISSSSAPAKTADLEVRQGYLESSNVPVAESAVRLVSVMRQFEMLQRAIALGGEMNRKAVEEVARVSS